MRDERARLREADLRHVWHPYTQMQELAQDDFPIIASARGRKLVDVDGREWWDGTSSVWLNVHGHRVPEIDEAVRRQLDQVAHATLLGQASVPSIRLAQRLARVAPAGLARVFYSDNGSTAVEAAIKMAIQYWHLERRPAKRRILSFEGGYHGDTLGCVGAAYVPAFHAPFDAVLPERARPLPWPDAVHGRHRGDPDAARDAALAKIDARLSAEGPATAGVLVEPMVQGVGGVRVMPPGFLRALRRLCREHEVLLIADEVATGFGRTGRMFACDHEGVAPDLMAVGKGITGGYLPLAATLATDEIHDAFLGRHDQMRQFFHGHSYTGNALGCAAAIASLDLLEARLPEVARTGTWLAKEVQAFRDVPFVGDVRGLGFLHGFELVADKATMEPFPLEARAGWRVHVQARRLGLLARPYANVALFIPPLASTREELTEMLGLYGQALRAAAPELGALALAA